MQSFAASLVNSGETKCEDVFRYGREAAQIANNTLRRPGRSEHVLSQETIIHANLSGSPSNLKLLCDPLEAIFFEDELGIAFIHSIIDEKTPASTVIPVLLPVYRYYFRYTCTKYTGRPKLAEALLQNPAKQPAYRSRRSHEDFLCTLKDVAPSREGVADALVS